MATAAQTRANGANSQKSSGPTTQTGKATSAQNRTTHGLCHHNAVFYLLDDENPEKFQALRDNLEAEHKPQTETERILVRRMADHEWLRTRALRLQHACIFEDSHVRATPQFALYMRYQSTHERGFYKALTELQNLRNIRLNHQIGFVAQKRQQVVEQRAAEIHEMKKQEFEWKKLPVAQPAKPEINRKETPQPAPVPEASPDNLEMAA
jgi:hypothetical protein